MVRLQRVIWVVLLCGLSVIGLAQDDEGSETPPREIYTVLGFGDSAFETDVWRASATEEIGRTSATWSGDEFGALAFLEYLHTADTLTPEIFPEYFDLDWFEVTLGNYDTWQETETCTAEDGSVIYDFDVTNNDIDYVMRYWIIEDRPQRVIAAFLVFPTENLDVFEQYAERFMPDYANCAALDADDE